jgi:hypothetical protein
MPMRDTMQRQPLARHLLEANLTLSRENSAMVDYLISLESTLKAIEVHGKNSGVVELQRLSEVRRQLRSIVNATEDRRIAQTGLKDSPSLGDLAKGAQQDEKINSYIFNIDIDPVKYDKMLEKMLNDMFKPKGDEPPPPPPQTYDGAVYFFKSINWGKNFGGDLEGEWQDYQDEENPEDPLDER